VLEVMEQIAVSNGWTEGLHRAFGASGCLHSPAPFGIWDAWDTNLHPTRNARKFAAGRSGKPNVQEERDFSRPERPIFNAVQGRAGDELKTGVWKPVFRRGAALVAQRAAVHFAMRPRIQGGRGL
jgi:hypothetical protein